MDERTLRFTTDQGDTIDFQFVEVQPDMPEARQVVKVFVNGAGLITAVDDPIRAPDLIHQLKMCGAEEVAR